MDESNFIEAQGAIAVIVSMLKGFFQGNHVRDLQVLNLPGR
jgi:hypothetical protein